MDENAVPDAIFRFINELADQQHGEQQQNPQQQHQNPQQQHQYPHQQHQYQYQQQSQPQRQALVGEPEPEYIAEPTPPSPQPSTTNRNSKERQQTLFKFVYNDEKIFVPKNEVIPSGIAKHFKLNLKDIKFTRGDKDVSIDSEEDEFVPNLIAGKKYTIIKKKVAKLPPPVPIRRHPKQSNEDCHIIINGQKQSISSGAVKKQTIVEKFQLEPRQQHIQLIGHNGNVQSNSNQYTLNPGTTYYAILSNQPPLKKEVKEVAADPNSTFSMEFAFMPPFMAALVRIFYALSFIGDSITFSAAEKNDERKQKLHCSDKLSTAAYQIAYRYNNVLDVINEFARTQSSYKNLLLDFMPNDSSSEYISDDKENFEDAYTTQIFFDKVQNIVSLLGQAHEELEVLLEMVINKIKVDNPAIESVKMALKIETNKEMRAFEKLKKHTNDPINLKESCNKICDGDAEILPRRRDLYAISMNRNTLNHIFELFEKVQSGIADNNILEDIVNLLDYCSKISHCNLLQWIFTQNLWKHVVDESGSLDSVKTTKSYENKRQVAAKICIVLNIWNAVSRGEPLVTDLNKSGENIEECWNKLKEEVINSQYALEICYDDQNSEDF